MCTLEKLGVWTGNKKVRDILSKGDHGKIIFWKSDALVGDKDLF